MRLKVPRAQLASRARQHFPKTKLLVINNESGTHSHAFFNELGHYLNEGDVLVANNAATIPASFQGSARGKPIELRLAANLEPNEKTPRRWLAVLFGEGSWKTPTERRAAAPLVSPGDTIELAKGLSARIEQVRSENNRLVEVSWRCDLRDLWRLLYRAGRPVQYSYLKEDLKLWDTQTLFATRPVAVEAPSAAFPLTWNQLFKLNSAGVKLVSLTHAAGLSSTGDPSLDRLLPFDENYSIPSQTAAAINDALANGKRIIAIGTTVVRALESAFDVNTGHIEAKNGVTSLKLSAARKKQVVTSLITGLHEPGASHLELLSSFAPSAVIESAYADAIKRNYLWHEYGDACLIL